MLRKTKDWIWRQVFVARVNHRLKGIAKLTYMQYDLYRISLWKINGMIRETDVLFNPKDMGFAIECITKEVGWETVRYMADQGIIPYYESPLSELTNLDKVAKGDKITRQFKEMLVPKIKSKPMRNKVKISKKKFFKKYVGKKRGKK